MVALLMRRSRTVAEYLSRPRTLIVTLAVLLAYGSAFTALHHVAAQWQSGTFSLWFPAAGLRFAFLWRAGARMAPAAALAELVVQLATGESTLEPLPALAVIGIVSPCLVYGAVIYLVKAALRGRTPILSRSPLPFALAAVAGPIAACCGALPWAIPLAMTHGAIDSSKLLHTLIVFTLGDMLGVLIVAPPLLWLADRVETRQAWIIPRSSLLVEAALVSSGGWALIGLIWWNGLGIMLAPTMLATCWVGLRTGRVGAWFAILLAAAIVLPLTGLNGDEVVRLRMHMVLACIAAVGYLVGSYSEAMEQARGEIARRDRMLFQAERLKTLRVMSVAVIHEISQPLSTISIEANNLVSASAALPDEHSEISTTAHLIARKANDLSEMVRRLRGFGGRTADLPSALPLQMIYHDLADIVAPDARAAQVEVAFADSPEAVVIGQDVELRQALLNLLRNAIASSPQSGLVAVTHAISGDRVRVAIENDKSVSSEARPGMGVGLIIARAIAAAHGGSIYEERPAPDRARYVFELPLSGVPND
jgi:signal transduction histidine kinase